MADTNTVQEMERFSVEGKVIVVTGACGVLGKTYCRALAQRGAHLVIADLASTTVLQQAEELVTELGAKVVGVHCDVSSETDVIELFQSAMAHFKRVDVVLNNAAATGEHLMRHGEVFSAFEDYPLAVWQQVIATNLTGVFLVAREGGKAMLKSGGGSLINVSSIYAIAGPDHRIYQDMPFSSFPGYSASKAGVHGLTLWLATYWGDKGIRVNTLVPGGVYNNHLPAFTERYANRTPMGRMANRDDLVGAVVFLASAASVYYTGQQLIVDGGLSAW